MAGCKTVFLCSLILAFFPSRHNSLTHPYFVWLLLEHYVQITEKMSNFEISVYSHPWRSRRQLQSNRENREISEIFLECYCVARKKPIRYEKTKLQARLLISLWFCGLFTCPDLCRDWSWHNKHSWDISSVHGFPGCTLEFTNVREVYKGKREPLGSCRRTSFFKFWLFLGQSQTRNLNAQVSLELFL